MGGMHMGQGPGIREFNRLYKELDDLYHNLALRQGLSDSASIILYALYLLGDGCLQRDICDLSYISKQTINSSIRRLEQDGYLYLQPGRGRDMHICLTPEGRRLVEEKAAPVAAMEERAFSGMPQEDQQALLRLTHAYLARLRAEAGRILYISISHRRAYGRSHTAGEDDECARFWKSGRNFSAARTCARHIYPNRFKE